MHIDRRSALRQLFIISAGVAILPACVSDKKPANEEEILAALSSAIIPTTDTPGAKEVAAHVFALRMVNDCYNKENREKFMNGFKQFRDKVQQQYGKSFEKCTAEEQAKILAAAAQGAGDDAAYFFNNFKNLTIQGFTESEYFLTKVEVYKLVPGKYISSVKV